MTAHPLFNRIAEGLSADGWYEIPDFVKRDDVLLLREQAKTWRDEGEFRRAGIGKQNDFNLEKEVRGDEILWLEDELKTVQLDDYFSRLEALMTYLNQTCYLGLKDYESHFAVYPKGAHYARHSDRFRQNAHRVVSFVLYLNPDWTKADGGELMIYTGEGDVEILPSAGKLVCFRSEIEHEVRECHQPRYSLTGWFLDKPVGLTFL